MNPKFYIGRVRYESLNNSRYKDYTYGDNKFVDATEAPEANGHGTYGKLLFDKRWIDKRAQILLRDNRRCVICKDPDNLQVHHRQYHFIRALKQFKAPWDYDDHLMITLCEKCHTRGHRKFRVPHVYL